MRSGHSILQSAVEPVGVRKHKIFFTNELGANMKRSITVFLFLTDPNLSQEARDKALSDPNFDSQRLAAFLRSASQVIFFIVSYKWKSPDSCS